MLFTGYFPYLCEKANLCLSNERAKNVTSLTSNINEFRANNLSMENAQVEFRPLAENSCCC